MPIHLLLTASILLAPVQESGDPVTFTITVDRALDDSFHSLERLGQLAGALPSSLHVVRESETLSGIILARYGVSAGSPAAASWLPRTYAWIRDQVATRSGGSDLSRLGVGDTLWLPTIPPRARSEPGMANLANQSPLAVRLPLLAAEDDLPSCKEWPEGVKFGLPLRDSVPGSRASQLAELVFSLPAGVASCARVVLEASPRIGALSVARHLSIPFPEPSPKPAEEPGTYAPPEPFTLSDPFKAALTRRLRQPGVALPMIVLDTGWPSRPARDTAWAALREMLTWFDTTFGLGADLPESLAGYPFQRPSQPHVLGIDAALRPLEALDSIHGNRVRVLYLPLTVDQPGSEVVIRQLLYVYQAFDEWLQRSLIDRLGTPTLSATDRREIRKEVDRIVRRIPPSLTSNQITTHSLLIDAVRYLSGQYSYRTGAPPFVVNFSWTAPAQAIRLTDSEGVLTVAAAGNDGKDILYGREPPLDFAARSAFGGGNQYLTVFVLDAKTGINRCSSAHFRSTPAYEAESLFAVGFNGTVADHGCQTSWASPRVAWLVAARWGASYRRDQSALPSERLLYLLHKTVERLRGHSAEAKHFVLDPVAFLESAS